MTREEIKQRYSMRDVLARYGMTPNAAGFIRCPFHKGDREASLKIYEKDYNCYGCGENGDVFTFIMRMEDIPFREAYMQLGGEYENTYSLEHARRRIRFERERREATEREEQFQAWRMDRLTEICGCLRACDAVSGAFLPLSTEMSIFTRIRQENEYKYQLLAFGTREEQEAMRADGG